VGERIKSGIASLSRAQLIAIITKLPAKTRPAVDDLSHEELAAVVRAALKGSLTEAPLCSNVLPLPRRAWS
jgi:hypothetical protein